MKILLNIDPIRYPLTGIGRYVYELAFGLRKSDRLEELLFWDGTRATVISNIPFMDTETGKRLPVPRATWQAFLVRNAKKNLVLTNAYRNFRDWRNSRRMRMYCERNGCIYHNTNYQLPDFPGVKVVTFFDLSVFHFPDCHPSERVRVIRKSMEIACNRANVIVTISDFSKKCIAEYFGYSEERIYVTRLAAAEEFKPMNCNQAAPILEHRRLSFKRYSLFVGTIEPRKNLDFLLDVYESLPVALRARFPLVVCGDEGWRSERTHARLRTAETNGWVRYFKFVPQYELPFLMAGAALFLFPSLYEGFGLPPLEAMQCGVPVVTSNRASLPEVVGDTAVLLDPEDRDAWFEATRESLENPDSQAENIQRGLARATQFSWDRCASETVAVYEAAMSGY